MPDPSRNQLPPPCTAACPVGTDARRYVGLILQGRFEEALEAITENNAIASICGYICAHPCEAACRRGAGEDPVAIRALKRFVLDHTREHRRRNHRKPHSPGRSRWPSWGAAPPAWPRPGTSCATTSSTIAGSSRSVIRSTGWTHHTRCGGTRSGPGSGASSPEHGVRPTSRLRRPLGSTATTRSARRESKDQAKRLAVAIETAKTAPVEEGEKPKLEAVTIKLRGLPDLETKVQVNPSEEQARALLNKSKMGTLRGVISDRGDLYFWDAYDATHADFMGAAGINPAKTGNMWETYFLATTPENRKYAEEDIPEWVGNSMTVEEILKVWKRVQRQELAEEEGEEKPSLKLPEGTGSHYAPRPHGRQKP